MLLRTSSSTGHGIGTALSQRIQELADVYAFLFDQLGVDYSLIDRGPLIGVVTPSSATVKVKLAQAGMEARLVLSKSPLLTRRIYSERAVSQTNQYNVVEFPLNRLEPDTPYYYGIEIDGRLERTKRGLFRTFQPGPASKNFLCVPAHRSPRCVRPHSRKPSSVLPPHDFQHLDIAQTAARVFARYARSSLAAVGDVATPLAYIWTITTSAEIPTAARTRTKPPG